MTQSIQVDWRSGTPFMLLIEDLTARASRRWNTREPTEALSTVWLALRADYAEGRTIEPGDGLLRTTVSRRVGNHFARGGAPISARRKWVSLDPRAHEEYLDSREVPPDRVAEWRELVGQCLTRLTGLSPRCRDAVLCRLKLGDARGPGDLARDWGTSPQNVHKHAQRGLERLRAALADAD